MEFIMQNLRYGGIAIGMLLVGLGWTTQDEVNTGVGHLTTAAGAIATAVTWSYGVWVKWKTRAVPVDVAARGDIPTVSGVTGAEQPPEAFRG